jgi:predicted RNase H-like nuclease (RuvC/YqgF family)
MKPGIREKLQVLKVHPLIFLFLVQFFLILCALTILLFIRNRKLATRESTTRAESQRFEAEIRKREGSVKVENDDVSKWKAMVNDMQNKFEAMRSTNIKLKELIERLIPEADRSKEYEELLSGIEITNKELDTCVGTLENKNKELETRAESIEREAEGLAELLQKSVRKEELDMVLSQKEELELKVEELEKELENKTNECDTLTKQFEWLKKEYNSLYREDEEEAQASS